MSPCCFQTSFKETACMFCLMKQHWCRSTVMPECGSSIIQDGLKPRSHTKLPKYPWMTRNTIYVSLSHCWRLQAFYYPTLFFSLRFGEKINYPSEIDWNSIGFIIDFLSIILFILWFVLLLLCLSNHLVRFKDFMSLMSNW